MERLNEQATRLGLDVQVAQRRYGEAVVGAEIIKHAFPLAIGTNLVVYMEKNLGRHHLDLKAGLIRDVGAAAEGMRVFATHAKVHEPATLGKRLVDVGHFREQDVGILPTDKVPGGVIHTSTS